MHLAVMEVRERQSKQEGGQRGGDGVVRPEVEVVPRPPLSERVRDRAQGWREQEEETDERDQERRDPHPDRDPAVLVDDGHDQAETLLPGDHREIPWTAGGAGCVSRESTSSSLPTRCLASRSKFASHSVLAMRRACSS